MGLDKAILDTLRGNFVSKKIKEERLSKCSVCEKKSGLFCSECKCLLGWKCSIISERCPIGKWDSVE